VTLTRFECNDTLQAYDTTDITADRSGMVNLAANSASLSRISIAVKTGILNGCYYRNQFECPQRLWTFDDVDHENRASLYRTVIAQSTAGGVRKCQTNRCKCY